MNIKMIVTDLDGTLLRENKTISGYTISILKSCRKNGIKVVYATGRGHSALDLAPSLIFDGLVRVNGAVAYIGDKLVYNRLIPISDVRELLLEANKAGVKIAAELSGQNFANFNVTKKWPWIPRYIKADFQTLDIDAEKLYAIVDRPEVVDKIKEYLSDDYYLNLSRDNLAMIMHKEAKKSLAVAALSHIWGINQDEIVAFGDDTNDIDLLEYAGIGVAMANALDEVKAAADTICDTNENNGVAKWLEENVLNRLY